MTSIAPATGPAATAAAAGDDRAKLKAVAKQFEAVFLRQMIGSMRQASLGEDLLGGDAERQFRDMQDSRMADELANTGSFGIAELLVNQLGAKLSDGAAVTQGQATVAAAEAAAARDGPRGEAAGK